MSSETQESLNEGLTPGYFSNVCRTCLSVEEVYHIFKEVQDGITLCEIFESCLGVQIEENDDLPQNICKSCILRLRQVHVFITQCLNSDSLLRAELNNYRQNQAVIYVDVVKDENELFDSELTDGSLNYNNKVKLDSDYEELQRSSLNMDLLSVKDEKKAEVALEDPLPQVSSLPKVQFEIAHHTIDIQAICEKVDRKLRSPLNLILENDAPMVKKPLETLDEMKFSCNRLDCKETFLSYHDLIVHRKEFKHKRGCEIECLKCKKKFRSNCTLRRHLKVHDKPTKMKRPAPKSHICKHCNMVFGSFHEWKDHRKEMNHPRRIKRPCPICSKACFSSDLVQHMRTHSKEKPFSCEICKKQFSLKRNLARHTMIHTSERPYVCQYCGKGFIQNKTYKEHVRQHTGETPYQCSNCGKSYARQSSYMKHCKSHTSDKGESKMSFSSMKKFQCHTCDKKFSFKTNLLQHMIIHGDKNFLCNYCGKTYYTKSILNQHMATHTGAKTMFCQVCGKGFSSSTVYYLHLRIHTGKKPYVCKVCNKAFTQNNHLKYHIRTHSGEKPYSCTICGKSFSSRGTLTVHVRIHTGETPFICDVCGKGFYDSNNMKKHKKIHNK